MYSQIIEGTKQAAKNWYDAQNEFILSYDSRLQRHTLDPCLYYIDDGSLKFYVQVHTDDYIAATNNSIFYDDFYTAYNKKYPYVNNGNNIQKFLGIYFKWDIERGLMYFSQEGLIMQVVEKFGLKDTPTKDTPMVVGATLPHDTTLDPSIQYLELLGVIAWIGRNTRPDVGFSVCWHAQFCNCYTKIHFESLKRVLLYLKGTKSDSLIFYKNTNKQKCRIKTVVDAEHAGDKHDRRSFMGTAVFVDGNLIGWWVKKQTTVSLSSMEAEYVGLCAGGKNTKYVLMIYQCLGIPITLPITIYTDSNASRLFSDRLGVNERTKRIDTAYHWVKLMIQNGTFFVAYINTHQNVADIFTKALCKVKTRFFALNMLGHIKTIVWPEQ